MHCLKCGRKIEDTDAFCADCLEDMAKYPIQPGTVVKLPSHPVTISAKKRPSRRKKSLKPEEQIASLKLRCRWLTILLILAIVTALLALGGMLWMLGWLDKVSIPGFTFPFGG